MWCLASLVLHYSFTSWRCWLEQLPGTPSMPPASRIYEYSAQNLKLSPLIGIKQIKCIMIFFTMLFEVETIQNVLHLLVITRWLLQRWYLPEMQLLSEYADWSLHLHNIAYFTIFAKEMLNNFLGINQVNWRAYCNDIGIGSPWGLDLFLFYGSCSYMLNSTRRESKIPIKNNIPDILSQYPHSNLIILA